MGLDCCFESDQVININIIFYGYDIDIFTIGESDQVIFSLIHDQLLYKIKILFVCLIPFFASTNFVTPPPSWIKQITSLV